MVGRFVLCALFLAGILGCGEKNRLQRYAVAGKVTRDGAPMESGKIWFEPDPSLGNRGPAGFAIITKGAYATTARQGVVGGPHIAVIRADMVPDYSDSAGGNAMKEIRMKVDLPKASTTHDFNVSGM